MCIRDRYMGNQKQSMSKRIIVLLIALALAFAIEFPPETGSVQEQNGPNAHDELVSKLMKAAMLGGEVSHPKRKPSSFNEKVKELLNIDMEDFVKNPSILENAIIKTFDEKTKKSGDQKRSMPYVEFHGDLKPQMWQKVNGVLQAPGSPRPQRKENSEDSN
eukprot:TRINITY_DN850_c0_g1_i1.p1 TRINITY_DN850_c0_g1~~TRINITY_DN850_c0_g1_i1.p1  ORF type:complete len:181 (-),score=63.04 TRINITY_DN850_c0_g1_i1:539-1021(-)